MAASEITAANTVRYPHIADPSIELVKITAIETADWFYSKWKYVDAVFLTPTSASWAAADAYAATVDSTTTNKIIFTLVGTATRPFYAKIYGHD
jgi:hypothetical protein